MGEAAWHCSALQQRSATSHGWRHQTHREGPEEEKYTMVSYMILIAAGGKHGLKTWDFRKVLALLSINSIADRNLPWKVDRGPAQLLKTFCAFMELEYSSVCLQEADIETLS
jgi:hypothetical protein